MSQHIQTTGRVGGTTLILFGAIGQWLADHGLSTAMVWIALVGLVLNVFTGLPAIVKSCDLIRIGYNRMFRGKP